MAYDLEEQEQLAQLKGWWRDNGSLVIAFVAVTAIAVAGWLGWRNWQAGQTQQASALYESLVKAMQADDAKTLRDAGGTLVESFPRTLYASMGALASAKFHFEKGDLKNARAQLQWVMERSSSDELKDLARLRLAGVLLDDKAHDEALALLEAKHAEAMAAQYAALKGDILVAKKQTAEAKAAYKQAIEKAGARENSLRASVQLRLDGLGRLIMRSLFMAGAALAVLTLPACSSLPSMPSLNPIDWFTSKSTGPKPAELPVLSNAQGVKQLWSSTIGAGEQYVFTPALSGDSVYAASRSGTVARLDAATGQAKWRISVGKKISGGVGTDGALAVVATEEGEVFALDAQNGTVRWRARVSSEVLAAPKVAEELVLVRSADSRIFAFGAEDGKRRWVYQRAAASLIVRSPVGLSVSQGSAYAGFSGGKLAAIALGNGSLRWEATVALPKGSTELERVTDIVGEPAVQGREVCTAAYQGRVACYDVVNGNQIWTREMSTLTGVSFDARYAFISDDKGAVHALDRSNGRSIWKQDRLAYRQLSLPLPLGTEVAAGDLQGFVHFMARESGAFLARTATDGSAIRAAPQKLPAGGFLVQTQGGGLYALTLN